MGKRYSVLFFFLYVSCNLWPVSDTYKKKRNVDHRVLVFLSSQIGDVVMSWEVLAIRRSYSGLFL